MTSASSFAKHHTSVWSALAPTTELFMRRMNASKDRLFPPLQSEVNPKRRGILNEAAFKLLASSTPKGEGNQDQTAETIAKTIAETEVEFAKAFGVQPRLQDKPTDAEISEVQNLQRRLFRFLALATEGQAIEFYPKFNGCGILDPGVGDLFFGSKLFEVKSGDRRFVAADVRQLLVYAALNQASPNRQIEHLGLVNPRAGIAFLGSVDTVCMEVSGRPAAELLSQIIRIASSGDISR